MLKLIAIFTMTIDHIGAFIFPAAVWMRVIGRLSYPIFAWLVVKGIDRTSNINKYRLRLFGFALLSQVVFMLTGSQQLNVLFTLALGTVAIEMWQQKNKIFMFLPIVIGYVFRVEYGSLGIILMLLMYAWKDNIKELCYSYIITMVMMTIYAKAPIQLLSLLALPIIILDIKDKINDFKLPLKYLYYFYYPVHLFIIMLIAKIRLP